MIESTEPEGVKERPQKRIRTSKKPAPSKTAQKSSGDTRLFAPFRALGLVTNHLPFYLQARSYKGATEGPRIHLLTCLGKSWALWEGGKMTLLFVGEYITLGIGRILSRSSAYRARGTRSDFKFNHGGRCNLGGIRRPCHQIPSRK